MTDSLSLTGKRWTVRHSVVRGSLVELLRAERKIDLRAPGKLSDPLLFPEMAIAVQRIERAMEDKEVVAIFGDYDADGITASAQLIRFFRRRGVEPVVHLPHRAAEGYGMKTQSIDALKARGATLIITVDTGIAAHAEIAHASALGMDVIVTDHHRPQGGRPSAYAVIHPLIPGPFPNEHLSGSGVAFMLVRALEKNQPWDGIDLDVALASIGTIGDLVPLTGENRTLVIHGLKFLEKLPPSPLRDFIDDVRGSGALTAGDVAFKVVPRINAAGRMAHPNIALQALLEGGKALGELHRLNGDRQSLVDELDGLLKHEADSGDLFIVVASDRVTPGTAGLIASRFTERSGRPSLIAAVLGDTAVASIRSPVGIDVTDCLSHPSVKPLLRTFGGHAQAAGCTFDPDDTPRLRHALNEVLSERGVTASSLSPSLSIDAELPASSISLPIVRSLRELEPFGTGNDEPVLLLRGQMLSDLRTVGTEGAHLQCRVGGFKAVGFRLGTFASRLGAEPVDLACRLGINMWNGTESLQLVIEDIRRAA